MADQMSREAALKSNPLVSVGLAGDSLSAKVAGFRMAVCMYVSMYDYSKSKTLKYMYVLVLNCSHLT